MVSSINPNQNIKDAIKHSSAKKWQVANELGITESALTVRLHKPLSKTQQQQIMTAIKNVEAEIKAAESKKERA